MQPIKVIIVDDEPAARRLLRECCDAEPDLQVLGEYGDPRAALDAIRAHPPQLLFLDVQMDTMNGLDLARALDQKQLPLIVFVTAYDHYALDAFEVCAIDYLLKPFDEERFQRALQRVRSRHLEQSVADRERALDALLTRLGDATRPVERPRLLAAAQGREYMLDPAQIELVEADRNYVRFRVGTASYVTRNTLQQVEEALQTQPFLRVSRSCLVNVQFVREVSRTPRGDFILVLACGATVTSSEGFRERVRTYLDRLRV